VLRWVLLVWTRLARVAPERFTGHLLMGIQSHTASHECGVVRTFGNALWNLFRMPSMLMHQLQPDVKLRVVGAAQEQLFGGAYWERARDVQHEVLLAVLLHALKLADLTRQPLPTPTAAHLEKQLQSLLHDLVAMRLTTADRVTELLGLLAHAVTLRSLFFAHPQTADRDTRAWEAQRLYVAGDAVTMWSIHLQQAQPALHAVEHMSSARLPVEPNAAVLSHPSLASLLRASAPSVWCTMAQDFLAPFTRLLAAEVGAAGLLSVALVSAMLRVWYDTVTDRSMAANLVRFSADLPSPQSARPGEAVQRMCVRLLLDPLAAAPEPVILPPDYDVSPVSPLTPEAFSTLRCQCLRIALLPPLPFEEAEEEALLVQTNAYLMNS
jgi:hypothetical protein